jgi:hypothetical protein
MAWIVSGGNEIPTLTTMDTDTQNNPTELNSTIKPGIAYPRIDELSQNK